MVNITMLRYHNTNTMKMSEAELHMLKFKVELLDSQFMDKHGHSNYEVILLAESKKMAQAQELSFS